FAAPDLGLSAGTRHITINTVTTASGAFRKNTHRHDPCSTSHPPSTGPSAVIIIEKPDQVPIALPRLSGGKCALTSARLFGTSIAPPTPCNARAAINCPIPAATPHHIEAAANST